MEGPTHGEQEIIKVKRQINDLGLKKAGARIEKGRPLEVTREQFKEAVVEMRLDKLKQRERITQIAINKYFEVGETRVFLIDEIIETIAEFENFLPEDFFLLSCVTNIKGEIIDANIKLKDEKAYDRFGFGTIYIYEIKGFSLNEERSDSVYSTSIGKFFRSADSDELMVRGETELEYAQNKTDEKNAKNLIELWEKSSYSEYFIEFDGIEWKYVDDDDDDEEDEEGKKIGGFL